MELKIFCQWRRSVAIDTIVSTPIEYENSLTSIFNASTASGYHGTTTSGSVPLMYNRRKSETEDTIYYMEGLTIGINDSHSISRMTSTSFRAAIIWLGY